MRAILALEDGTVFTGRHFGASGEQSGEMVFNTSMTGYQEIITDPSYAGQIVSMTAPHIGNYGVNAEDNESRQPFLQGFVVRELSRRYSNWRAEESLERFLLRHNVIGIEGVDTRRLTRHIRSQGAMRAIISTGDEPDEAYVKKARAAATFDGRDLASEVSCSVSYLFGEEQASDSMGDKGAFPAALTASPLGRRSGASGHSVVAIDFGLKGSILHGLEAVGCTGRVVPADTPVQQILEGRPDGVFLSNGPGDPAAVERGIDTIRQLLGKVPIFGICLGHQLLSLALGGSTFKLRFGHRGGNQPVRDEITGRIEITSQNHGYAVDANSVPSEGPFGRVAVTHTNLNDNTVEGIHCLDVPAFSVQYHPEASPGPHDSFYLFDRFAEMMSKYRGVSTLEGATPGRSKKSKNNKEE